MRVLFTALPGTGHIHPLIPTMRELVGRGHEVRLATSRSAGDGVRGLGFEAVEIGPDWLEGGDDPISARLLSLENTQHHHFFAEIADMGAIPTLVDCCAAWHVDLIVSEHTEYAGRIAAEIAGLPVAVHVVGNPPPRELVEAQVADVVREIRRRFGLPTTTPYRGLFGDVYLDFVPPSLTPLSSAPPPGSVKVRPMVFEANDEEQLPTWLESLQQQPLVHASLGTVYNRTPGLLEVIVEALANQPLTLLVTTGRNRDPATLGPLPPNVRAERYMPHSLLLPLCSALITHGGFNTVIAALKHRLPMYFLPISADQPRNAQRAVEIGFGLSAADHGKPPYGPVVSAHELDPAMIRAGVRRLLDEPSFRRAAAAVSDEIERLPGLDYVADLLERLPPARPPSP